MPRVRKFIEQPYRKAMPVDKALSIMTEMTGTQINPVPFEALKRALKRVDAGIAA